jgi:ABC-type sugar transport system permease subunit
MKKNQIKKEIIDLTFLLPALALFIFIIFVPLISGIQFTFTDWDGMTYVKNFVGFKNYHTVLTDKDLLVPIKNTLFYTIITVVVINGLGLTLALAVQKDFCGVNIMKSIYFIPLVVSLVLVSQMWMYVYSDFFTIMRLNSPLINKNTVMLGLCFMSVWRESGLGMMIYLAALKTVPTEMWEAAIIDGANYWQRLKNITLPFIAPAFTYCIPLWLAGGLRQFDYSMVATQGGPGHASESMAYYIYNYLFPYNKVGYGQTVALFFFVACLLISNILIRVLRKKEIEL